MWCVACIGEIRLIRLNEVGRFTMGSKRAVDMVSHIIITVVKSTSTVIVNVTNSVNVTFIVSVNVIVSVTVINVTVIVSVNVTVIVNFIINVTVIVNVTVNVIVDIIRVFQAVINVLMQKMIVGCLCDVATGLTPRTFRVAV